MAEVKEQKCSDIISSDVNLFKPELFQLFCNVQEVFIREAEDHAFNLERLLQYAMPKSMKRIIIEGSGWLTDTVTDTLKQSINLQGWDTVGGSYSNGIMHKLKLVRRSVLK